jgi:lipoate-protein ligase A
MLFSDVFLTCSLTIWKADKINVKSLLHFVQCGDVISLGRNQSQWFYNAEAIWGCRVK